MHRLRPAITWLLDIVVVLGVGLIPLSARAEFGTEDLVIHTVAGIQFVGDFSPPGIWTTNADTNSRSCDSGDPEPCSLFAPVHLPAGALITKFEANVCRDAPIGVGNGRVQLRRVAKNKASPVALATVAIPAGSVGCETITGTLGPAATVNNENNVYFLRYQTDSPEFSIQAVRVFFKRQVSPAPAVATFTDVPPTHAFFQFVEAMVAAGITSGCSTSPPLYCPDDPLTRGQMAAFFSIALGLHFAP